MRMLAVAVYRAGRRRLTTPATASALTQVIATSARLRHKWLANSSPSDALRIQLTGTLPKECDKRAAAKRTRLVRGILRLASIPMTREIGERQQRNDVGRDLFGTFLDGFAI